LVVEMIYSSADSRAELKERGWLRRQCEKHFIDCHGDDAATKQYKQRNRTIARYAAYTAAAVAVGVGLELSGAIGLAKGWLAEQFFSAAAEQVAQAPMSHDQVINAWVELSKNLGTYTTEVIKGQAGLRM
jgi:hypothetical protein